MAEKMVKRVLHVLDHSLPLHSGYTFRTMQIIRALESAGIESVLLTSPKQHATDGNQQPADTEIADGLTFHRTAPGFLSRFPLVNQWDVIWQLRKKITQITKTQQIDLIHVHSPALNAIAAYLAKPKHGLPILYEMRALWEDAAVSHGTCQEDDLRYRLSKNLETFALKKADKITTICAGLKTNIRNRGIEADKITLIPNGVNLAHFEKTDPNILRDNNRFRALFGEHTGDLTVLGFMGSFYHYEGLDLLVEAMPSLIERHSNIRLLIVGGGAEKDNLMQQISALGLADHIKLVDRIPHDEIPSAYAATDICVYPRRQMRLTETVTPLKPLEAMAMRRPVVASNIGGHRELIENGKTGLLFEHGGEDIVTQIVHLIENHSLQQSLVASASQFVANERTWEACTAPYPNLYSEMVARHISAVVIAKKH